MGNAAARQGRLPREGLDLINMDGDPFVQETLRGKVILTHSGEKVPYRQAKVAGSIAVTDSRVIVYAYGKCLVHVTFAEASMCRMEFSTTLPKDAQHLVGTGKSKKKADEPCHPDMVIRTKASLLDPTWNGEAEVRFQTEKADFLCSRIQSRMESALDMSPEFEEEEATV